MKLNRSTNVYVELPVDVLSKNESKDAKAAISINVVMPKSFSNKKMQKFISDQVDQFAKEFKKAVKKEIKRVSEEKDE